MPRPTRHRDDILPKRRTRLSAVAALAALAALAIPTLVLGVAITAARNRRPQLAASHRRAPMRGRAARALLSSSSATIATTTSTTSAPVTSTTSSSTTSSSSTTVAAAPSAAPLTWAPPALVNPTVVAVTDSTPFWLPTFDGTRDYVVALPAGAALHHGIGITGGRNVVVIGGEIAIPSDVTDPQRRIGVALRDQTGTVHLEGLKITGASDGVNLQERAGATVQLQNLYVETPVPYENADGSGFHADIVQTWAGPAVLRIDHLTGRSSFQGLFLDPNDPNFLPHPALSSVDLRNINVDSNGAGSGYDFETVARGTTWASSGANIYGTNPTGHIVFTGYGPFPAVTEGRPPAGDFVPADRVGVGYRSPGYR